MFISVYTCACIVRACPHHHHVHPTPHACVHAPVLFRFYASDRELYRIFKSINGIVFPVGP